MECDSARVEYVQRLMGEMLIGKPQRRRLFYAYGPAGTGKSTITHVMHEILGKFAEGIDFASVAMRDKTGGDRPRPDLVCLRGKRLITAVESRQNDRLDAARLKQVVGGDLMSVRNLYKGQVTFAIQAVIFLSGNERPIIDAGDDFWPKFKVLPFKYAFPHQDVNFFDRVLCPELVGILTWCVEGLRKLIAGDWVLIDPPAVVAETAEYRADENRLAPFFAEMCELDPLFKSKPTALWDAYTAWFASHNNSIGRGMMGDRTFYAKLVSDSRITRLPLSHGVRSYGGIRVRPDVQTALDSGAYDARRIQRSAGNSGSQEPDF
jgi:putative DNA primase/helicase